MIGEIISRIAVKEILSDEDATCELLKSSYYIRCNVREIAEFIKKNYFKEIIEKLTFFYDSRQSKILPFSVSEKVKEAMTWTHKTQTHFCSIYLKKNGEIELRMGKGSLYSNTQETQHTFIIKNNMLHSYNVSFK